MRNLNKEFENKTINTEELLKYGFRLNENTYIYEKAISDNQFKICIEISKDSKTSKVIDLAIDEEYVLVDVKDSSGNFVGKIKEEYEAILNDILEKCTTPNVFKSNQSKLIIKYIKEKYNDDLEYLWSKFPNNAVWRNKENNKWYGIVLVIPENKLGLDSDSLIEIIDLRYQKDSIKERIDNNKIFPGYHMNKSSWITIKLDETVSTEEIYKLIDNSYNLSLEK